MLKRLLVLSVVAAGTASVAKAEPIVIDNFGSPSSQVEYQIDLLTPGSNVYSQTHSVGNGLTRTTTVVVTDPDDPDFNSASGTIGKGAFSMATNDGTNAYATLAYSGFAGAGLSDFSLHSALQLSFRKVDSGLTTDQLPFGVVVRTATGSFTYTGSIADTNSQIDLGIPLSAFSGSGDWGQVEEVVIALNSNVVFGPDGVITSYGLGGYGADFTLVGVTVTNPVPAPPAVVLGLLALPVAGLARRLRRA